MLKRAHLWTVIFFIITGGSSLAYAQESGVVDTPIINPVDPNRAKNDFQRAQETSFAETLGFPKSLKFGDFNPVVPIMIPMKVFRDLQAGVTADSGVATGLKSRNQESAVTFNENGYFATVSDPAAGYNLTVEGSRRAFSRQNDDASFTEPKPDYFNVFDDGAKFGYSGADYLLLFECIEGDVECIMQDGINNLVKGFVLCNNDNQCVNFFPEK